MLYGVKSYKILFMLERGCKMDFGFFVYCYNIMVGI